MSLRAAIIKLAYTRPELANELLPLLKAASGPLDTMKSAIEFGLLTQAKGLRKDLASEFPNLIVSEPFLAGTYKVQISVDGTKSSTYMNLHVDLVPGASSARLTYKLLAPSKVEFRGFYLEPDATPDKLGPRVLAQMQRDGTYALLKNG